MSMSKDYQQKVKALQEGKAKYEDSLKKVNEVTNYLKRCKFIEALNLNTKEPMSKAILHVINQNGEEDIVENDYVQGLLNNVRNYRVELARGLVSNEKIIKEALGDLEKSKKDLGL
jgi:hypothetical protein